METKISRLMYIYGAFLVFIGIISFISDQENGKEALITCIIFGALSIIWGFQIKYSIAHSVRTATLSTMLLIIVFTWRAALGWQHFFYVETDKILSVAMMTLLMPASVVLFLSLNRSRIES